MLDTQFKTVNAEQAMSNQEVLSVIKPKANNNQLVGNAQINTNHWQRKNNNTLIINELISESSSPKDSEPLHKPEIIDVRVKNNRLHADLGSDGGSSSSSVHKGKRVIKFTKKQSKVIPHPPHKNSDSSSSDSDQDLLPDLFYTTY
jgi:hypothetical protein